jgi:hypothetical protein
MKISFLHTAQVHVDTFDAILATLAPDTERTHHVAPELLARAQANGLNDIAEDTSTLLNDLSQADAVLCSCSTLGPLVDDMNLPNVIRVDRPLMKAACEAGTNVIVAICLESTRKATLTLLDDVALENDTKITPNLVLCETAWPYFEQGDQIGFANQIAENINAEIARSGMPDCIVLAQASMRVAAEQLEGLYIPILSSPLLATQHLLRVAATSCERSSR